MITASDEYDDESELLVFSKIADDSFVLIDEFDTHSLLVPIYRDMVLVGLILLAILFFLGVWVSSLIRRNLRPLEDFRRVVLSMREKDFSQRVVFHTGDEIEELGTAFNVMAEELGEFYQSMDIKVGEKTKELAKFRLAVEHASDHIVITDTDGIILYANPAVTRITGFTREEILGKKAGSKDLWGGMMSQEFYDQMWQAIKIKQQVFSGEITNRRKGGELYQAIASIAPVVEGGQLLFFIGIERDITHEKQVDRAKTEFVSLASHQLRTPLTAINWYAEMLLDESGEHCSPEQREQMETILKSSQRMAELVDTLLNVSRLELGTFIIEPKPTDVVAILEEVLEELRVRIVEKRLEIIKDIDPEQIQGNMDTKLLRIIFQNLLSNAVKYTPEGGKVVVILKQTSTEYLLQVVDTGMGIPKCAQNQIFKKLFRADNVKQREVEGTGLGLYITKTIVETAGGTIGFHSVENEGTTFEVIFPPIGMLSKEGTKPLT
jgi:PAS domain S-box-containing protein